MYRFVASNTIEEKVYQRQLTTGAGGLALHQRDETRYDGAGRQAAKGRALRHEEPADVRASDASRLPRAARDILAGGRSLGLGRLRRRRRRPEPAAEGAEEGDAFGSIRGRWPAARRATAATTARRRRRRRRTAAVPRGRRRRRVGRPVAEAGIRWLLDKVEPGRAARKRSGGGGGEEQERGVKRRATRAR